MILVRLVINLLAFSCCFGYVGFRCCFVALQTRHCIPRKELCGFVRGSNRITGSRYSDSTHRAGIAEGEFGDTALSELYCSMSFLRCVCLPRNGWSYRMKRRRRDTRSLCIIDELSTYVTIDLSPRATEHSLTENSVGRQTRGNSSPQTQVGSSGLRAVTVIL